MEFAGVDKAARSKIGVWKMQEWTHRHDMARVDNAGVDNAGAVKCCEKCAQDKLKVTDCM